MNKKTEKVKKVIETYLKEVMPYHPSLPEDMWKKVNEALEVEDE